ncbi:WXG100 family type VII secretion target [Paenibacillus lemnae]|uniref:WXG100 family type VII secretion target n=1 Tax=Paenibacillus lemnae TaxID=1330551 RepID=A0A848M8Q3_PAELE|nr:hypothetical protein [Paenibacillus lemnae]NMO96273.1 hypothetical protein [Paenibacillus lemnae]
MRISVEPELLRTLSRQLLQSGDQFSGITNQLSQAMNSLVWETSLKAAVIDEWQTAQRIGEHVGVLLEKMGIYLRDKADLFQETDHQYNSILEHAQVGKVSPVSLFAASQPEGASSILPQSGGSPVISNPSSAAAAVGMTMGEGQESARKAALSGQGWTFTDPSGLGIAN